MTVTEQEITDYVERVRAALADLPPTVRDELTEDLPEHLTEVAAEADGTLVERLGEPAAYAAELRVAAGAAAPARDRRGERIDAAVRRLRARVDRLDTRLGPLLGYDSAGEFLRLLRPAWWVLRGYLAVALLGAILGGGLALLPRPFNSAILGLLLLAVAIPLSVSLGRRAHELRRRPRQLMHLGAVVLACFGLVLVGQFGGLARSNYPVEYYPVDNPYDSARDVFVYDGEGRLVRNARLFDQNGTPIRIGYPDCIDMPEDQEAAVRNGYPYCPEQAPFGPRPVPPAAPPAVGPTATADPSGTPAPTGAADPSGTPEPTGTAAPTGTPPPTGPTAEPTR
ncbi:hypothetical protein K7640_09690 [Micromonospora sp. PLK6-60]|uniref:HAAS signaling domain-containing protein n=1 Tax=Micromonospora sp. PLK6-60 TaxID=2873383 RepID=UPI001CA78D44|nr:hypothetical protein [Micromonospora sp. PLK6-60]MBY8872110.1 hypothetical protein [Micromonospora sp. PLK6-60]